MNRALTSDRAHQDFHYPLALSYYKILTLLLVEKGYEEGRFAVLEPACFPSGTPVLECRKAEIAEMYVAALTANVDLDLLPDVNSCNFFILATPEFTGTFATLTTALTGANNDLVFTSKDRGTVGNGYSVSYVDPSANNQALAVTVLGYHIRVSLATGVAGAITSTSALIKTAVEANAAAANLVSVAHATSNSGAGVVTAMAQTYLSGAVD